jgi:hypothetical protein
MSLNNELNSFASIFRQRLNASGKLVFRWVICDSVDWDNKTMNGLGDDDLVFSDILLGLSYVVKPVKGTDCLIAIVEGASRFASTSFLVMADEVELIEFNGGKNGGLAVVPELKTQLEKLSKRVDGLIDAVNSPNVAATPQDGGAALLTLLRGELAKITEKESFDKIEDTTIKH